MTSSIPFISILIRTQGKRFEALKETFLCLEAQTDDRFKIILLVHKADAQGRECVQRLLSLQSPDFAKKIHTEYIDEGTRTRPLNIGASLVDTPYFAMLDDDDVVFNNWIEEFGKSAQQFPNQVIRSYGCTQSWKVLAATDSDTLLCSEGPIVNQYCSLFDLVAQLETNYTPISCVAIPTSCYSELEIHFDESLTTTEDWDFIMRCVFAVGIVDTEKITFLYRLWSNAETSHTLHNDDEWMKNYYAIVEKFNKLPIHTTRQALLKSKINKVPSGVRMSYVKPFLQPKLGSVVKGLVDNIRAWIRCKRYFKKYLEVIEASEYFDSDWYCDKYPDVKKTDVSPAKHYILFGWQELRDPSEKFSTLRYLTLNPDVNKTSMCPLLHYEIYGKLENREI